MLQQAPPPPVNQQGQQQQAASQRVFTGTVTKLHDNFGFVDEDVFFQTTVVKGQTPRVNVNAKFELGCALFADYVERFIFFESNVLLLSEGQKFRGFRDKIQVLRVSNFKDNETH